MTNVPVVSVKVTSATLVQGSLKVQSSTTHCTRCRTILISVQNNSHLTINCLIISSSWAGTIFFLSPWTQFFDPVRLPSEVRRKVSARRFITKQQGLHHWRTVPMHQCSECINHQEAGVLVHSEALVCKAGAHLVVIVLHNTKSPESQTPFWCTGGYHCARWIMIKVGALVTDGSMHQLHHLTRCDAVYCVRSLVQSGNTEIGAKKQQRDWCKEAKLRFCEIFFWQKPPPSCPCILLLLLLLHHIFDQNISPWVDRASSVLLMLKENRYFQRGTCCGWRDLLTNVVDKFMSRACPCARCRFYIVNGSI